MVLSISVDRNLWDTNMPKRYSQAARCRIRNRRNGTNRRGFGISDIAANDGLLILKYELIPNGIWLDTIRYQVEPNVLILSDSYTSTVYHRTQLGAVVTSPIRSIFTEVLTVSLFRIYVLDHQALIEGGENDRQTSRTIRV
jgi:hypothetical protein